MPMIQLKEIKNQRMTTNKKEGNKRDPKKLEEDKEGEECTVNDDTNRVRICVPKVTSVDSTIHLNSGEVKEERNDV